MQNFSVSLSNFGHLFAGAMLWRLMPIISVSILTTEAHQCSVRTEVCTLGKFIFRCLCKPDGHCYFSERRIGYSTDKPYEMVKNLQTHNWHISHIYSTTISIQCPGHLFFFLAETPQA